MLLDNATNSLSVGLFVTHACFLDDEYTKVPATNTVTPECDFESACVANAASMYAITLNG